MSLVGRKLMKVGIWPTWPKKKPPDGAIYEVPGRKKSGIDTSEGAASDMLSIPGDGLEAPPGNTAPGGGEPGLPERPACI